jgi:hypothetical protein
VPLVAGLAVVVWALTLREPDRGSESVPVPVLMPTWTAPETVEVPGVLADGATYAPRLYLHPETSVGVATGADGEVRVILARSAGSFTELRRLAAEENAQVNGFAVDGDTLVWMESTTRAGVAPSTTLWRITWSDEAPPVPVTADTGAPNFTGFATDLVLDGGVASWTSFDVDGSGGTQLRSVPLTGGSVTVRPLDGEFRLTTPPWAVTAVAGPGRPVTLVNLENEERIEVDPGDGGAAVCDPTWCRVSVTGESGLVGIDVMSPDGTQRSRVAGAEATPIIGDPTLLDRYVPLAVDRVDGVGLALYDLTTGLTRVVALHASNVAGREGILWWSTGVDADLTWHALDLTNLS